MRTRHPSVQILCSVKAAPPWTASLVCVNVSFSFKLHLKNAFTECVAGRCHSHSLDFTSVGRLSQFWLVDERFYHHVTVGGTYLNMHKTETWKLNDFFCLVFLNYFTLRHQRDPAMVL